MEAARRSRSPSPEPSCMSIRSRNMNPMRQRARSRSRSRSPTRSTSCSSSNPSQGSLSSHRNTPSDMSTISNNFNGHGINIAQPMQPFAIPGAQQMQQMPMFGGQMMGLPQGMMPVPMMMVPSAMFAPNVYGTVAMTGTTGLNATPNLTKAADKVNRELFVGNTPSDSSEALMVEFLNGAMQRIKLCGVGRKPIIKCRLSAKFAFIECETAEDANRALNLNGIPFMGMKLRVSRPSKYAGPNIPCKTWQELTGQHLVTPPIPENNTADDDKVNRELYVGNTTPSMTESSLSEFLGTTMKQVGLTTQPGNPIVSCQMNGKFAFVEFRSSAEASAALNLNNIPFMNSQLRVNRPSKYAGPVVASGNWDEVLSKFMARELQTPYVPQEPQIPFKAEESKPKETRIVMLKNMLTADDLESDEDYTEVMEETKEECGKFGKLRNIVIPRTGVGATKIFLEYETTEDAAKAIKALAGRTFDGRTIDAAYMDEVKYLNQDYSG